MFTFKSIDDPFLKNDKLPHKFKETNKTLCPIYLPFPPIISNDDKNQSNANKIALNPNSFRIEGVDKSSTTFLISQLFLI